MPVCFDRRSWAITFAASTNQPSQKFFAWPLQRLPMTLVVARYCHLRQLLVGVPLLLLMAVAFCRHLKSFSIVWWRDRQRRHSWTKHHRRFCQFYNLGIDAFKSSLIVGANAQQNGHADASKFQQTVSTANTKRALLSLKKMVPCPRSHMPPFHTPPFQTLRRVLQR
jgi:hypothetical protein